MSRTRDTIPLRCTNPDCRRAYSFRYEPLTCPACGTTIEVLGFGLELWHPHFKWIPWEPGDTVYRSLHLAHLAQVDATKRGQATRVVVAWED